jgi:hypothetical protein
MSDKLYNLIMHSNPKFWSGNDGYIDFPKERFLEYTKDHLKKRFQSLDQSAISEIKKLPTLFATEEEKTDTRIGRITKVEVQQRYLRIYYKFTEGYYPLSNGVLYKKRNELNIEDFEFYRGHWAIKEGDISDFYENYEKSLTGIAHQLKSSNKKVQLIYGFNGIGKTQLSLEMKKLIAPKTNADGELDKEMFSQGKYLYYNAFTEDLFYWHNDKPKLKIQQNLFIDWILRTQGDKNIIKNFQNYTSDKLTPQFSEEEIVREGKKTGNKTYPEVTFSYERGDETGSGNIKISKGEESNFIWSIFYTLLEEIVSILEEPDVTKRSDDLFNELEYVFIDDPVSSLDENHLIELAVKLAMLLKKSAFTNGQGIKFVITTHSPLFYNVLWNEFNSDLYKNKKDGSYKSNNADDDQQYTCIYKRGQSEKYRLVKKTDGTFELKESNDHHFSYHLLLLSELKKAITNEKLEKYHFNFLRNILEKTATFLGRKHWENILEKAPDGHQDFFAKRMLNLSSHSAHAGDESSDFNENDKKKIIELVEFLTKTYGFIESEKQNG